MSRWWLLGLVGWAFSLAIAQKPAVAAPDLVPATVVLWPDGAPGAQGTADEDVPKLLVFLPARPKTSTGVLIVPGGGYNHLSLPTEGVEVAHFMNAAGIPAFVLKYRLGAKYRYPVQLQDAERAMRYLRANATRYRIRKLGTMGFSAGGHLVSELGTSGSMGDAKAADPLERLNSRPDFMVLIYPVIGPWGFAAEGSLRNIDPDTRRPVMQPKPGVPTNPPLDSRLIEMLSTDLHVTASTPPSFLVCADDDHSVFPENPVRFYLALKHAGVPAELHVYAHGGHGFGLAGWDPVDSTWTAHMLDWLRINGSLEPLVPARH